MSEEIIGRVREYLKKMGIVSEPIEFEQSTCTSDLAARALGVEVGQIAKTMVWLADQRPVLVVASGDIKIKSNKLRRFLGASKIKMADADTVQEVTGYPVGGVCPVALPGRVDILLDESMKRYDIVYTAAGTPRSALPLNMEQLQAVTGGEWVEVS